jgi:signal transduction histidine kinase
MNLRAVLTATTLILGALALLAASSLVILTTSMHDKVSELRASAENIRLAEEVEIDLLLHDRATDPLVRADLEQALRRKLDEARAFVMSEDERRAMAETDRSLQAYLAASRSGQASRDELDQAFRAVAALVDINIGQARRAEEEAARSDTTGNVVGLIVATVLVLGVAMTLLWIHQFAFQPLFATAAAMKSYGSGSVEARAPEIGPEEIRKLATQFNGMARNLAQQRERQMAFLACIAHDLRTPLAALKLSTGVIAPDGPLPPEDRVRRTAGIVRRQVELLDRMVGDFLDTARIEAGQLELKIDACDIRELVIAVTELFRSTSQAHTLILEAPADPLVIRCDAARVQQVLNNLISNAIKYAPAGGDVVIRVRREEKGAMMSVSDKGLGIPLDEQRSLFEPFQRARSSASAIPGLGLGLWISRRIARAHGGDIDLESAPGEGSTFTLRLPFDPPRA